MSSAMLGYLEAINSDTDEARRKELEEQLKEYCGMDTLAMVKLLRFMA